MTELLANIAIVLAAVVAVIAFRIAVELWATGVIRRAQKKGQRLGVIQRERDRMNRNDAQ